MLRYVKICQDMLRSQWATPAHYIRGMGWRWESVIVSRPRPESRRLKDGTGSWTTGALGRWLKARYTTIYGDDKCSKCSFVNGLYICDLAILNGYLSNLWGYNKDIAWHDMTWHDMTWHDMTWHTYIYIFHYIVLLRKPCERSRRVAPKSCKRFAFITSSKATNNQLPFFIGENDDDLDAFCGSFMSFASLSQIPSYGWGFIFRPHQYHCGCII